jgi:hypothetical protein
MLDYCTWLRVYIKSAINRIHLFETSVESITGFRNAVVSMVLLGMFKVERRPHSHLVGKSAPNSRTHRHIPQIVVPR